MLFETYPNRIREQLNLTIQDRGRESTPQSDKTTISINKKYGDRTLISVKGVKIASIFTTTSGWTKIRFYWTFPKLVQIKAIIALHNAKGVKGKL